MAQDRSKTRGRSASEAEEKGEAGPSAFYVPREQFGFDSHEIRTQTATNNPEARVLFQTMKGWILPLSADSTTTFRTDRDMTLTPMLRDGKQFSCLHTRCQFENETGILDAGEADIFFSVTQTAMGYYEYKPEFILTESPEVQKIFQNGENWTVKMLDGETQWKKQQLEKIEKRKKDVTGKVDKIAKKQKNVADEKETLRLVSNRSIALASLSEIMQNTITLNHEKIFNEWLFQAAVLTGNDKNPLALLLELNEQTGTGRDWKGKEREFTTTIEMLFDIFGKDFILKKMSEAAAEQDLFFPDNQFIPSHGTDNPVSDWNSQTQSDAAVTVNGFSLDQIKPAVEGKRFHGPKELEGFIETHLLKFVPDELKDQAGEYLAQTGCEGGILNFLDDRINALLTQLYSNYSMTPDPKEREHRISISAISNGIQITETVRQGACFETTDGVSGRAKPDGANDFRNDKSMYEASVTIQVTFNEKNTPVITIVDHSVIFGDSEIKRMLVTEADPRARKAILDARTVIKAAPQGMDEKSSEPSEPSKTPPPVLSSQVINASEDELARKLKEKDEQMRQMQAKLDELQAQLEQKGSVSAPPPPPPSAIAAPPPPPPPPPVSVPSGRTPQMGDMLKQIRAGATLKKTSRAEPSTETISSSTDQKDESPPKEPKENSFQEELKKAIGGVRKHLKHDVETTDDSDPDNWNTSSPPTSKSKTVMTYSRPTKTASKAPNESPALADDQARNAAPALAEESIDDKIARRKKERAEEDAALKAPKYTLGKRSSKTQETLDESKNPASTAELGPQDDTSKKRSVKDMLKKFDK